MILAAKKRKRFTLPPGHPCVCEKVTRRVHPQTLKAIIRQIIFSTKFILTGPDQEMLLNLIMIFGRVRRFSLGLYFPFIYQVLLVKYNSTCKHECKNHQNLN